MFGKGNNILINQTKCFELPKAFLYFDNFYVPWGSRTKEIFNDKFPFPGQNFEEKLIPHHGNTTLDKKFNAKLPGEKGRGGGAEGREGGLARLAKIE